MRQNARVTQPTNTRGGGMRLNRRSGSFAFRLRRSCASLTAVLCLPMLVGCWATLPTQPTAARPPGVQPMPPVPRLTIANPTAGDLFALTIQLYEDAGECRRRLDSALSVWNSSK